jgi:hypothetical protein
MKDRKHLNIILEKMFDSVGVIFTEDFCKTPNWFMKYSWTREQEDTFRKWLIEYLYQDIEARKELMSYAYKNKKSCERAANEFLFNYGWKYRD